MNSSPAQKLPSPATHVDIQEYPERRTTLVFSPELDSAFTKIFQKRSPLDANEINIVEYLNIFFPNGRILNIIL